MSLDVVNARVRSHGIFAFRCTMTSLKPPAVSTMRARGVTSTSTGVDVAPRSLSRRTVRGLGAGPLLSEPGSSTSGSIGCVACGGRAPRGNGGGRPGTDDFDVAGDG